MTTRSAAPSRLPLLQQRLILTRFFCDALGFSTLEGLLKVLRDVRPGEETAGGSHYYHALAAQEQVHQRPETLARLPEYDARIRGYVQRLNRFRSPPIRLLYFQYLAVLFTEMYLERLFDNRALFLADLNRFVQEENGRREPAEPPYPAFSDGDLNKMAFWMATGSGKTLVMHINLWQYLHHCQGHARPRNVLLITPNEGLSRQHLEELGKSGIAARRYGEAGSAFIGYEHVPVTVIEITKLTTTKSGGGLTVEVSAFGSDNLLLVDEGHRGAKGDVWRDLRARLAETGFTFEYSATFGQMVNGADPARRPALLEEYSRAILLDYSYRHFYHDGYGKDYWILNLKDETNTFNHWMLLGNLLSFAEQSFVFEEHAAELRPHNLEKPLWVFVGHSVTGGKTAQDRESLTDVQQIVAFFDSFLRQPQMWSKRIGQLLAGQAGLVDAQGNDLFQNLFPALREAGWKPAELYQAIVARILHGQAGETLRTVTLRSAPGEIGLRVGADRPYFGVINIGDVAGLMKLFAQGGIVCEEENISGSLFHGIPAAGSSVNVLVGSRKFMEGWDCYRVSSMGLMNIGRGEGSQIIQLFGRGVRLHGQGGTLKRSAALEAGGVPRPIRLLETLNVFGVRANYMAQFREYLQQEGIPTDYQEIQVPIYTQDAFLGTGLLVLRLSPGESFQERCLLALQRDSSVRVHVDLRPRLEVARSGKEMKSQVEQAGGQDQAGELRDWIELLDWDRLYSELLAFRQARGWYNLVFTVETLREMVEKGFYTLLCPEGYLPPARYQDLRRVEDLALAVLRSYLAVFYDRQRRAWERQRLQLAPLSKGDPNLDFSYLLRVRRSFAQTVLQLVKKADQIARTDEVRFPLVHFDRHLYQPLLREHDDVDWMAPPGLNDGERQFVAALRAYVEANPPALAGKQLFLLRNLTQGRGIGFFEPSSGETFYPDFVLWVLEKGWQWIAFLDPHGLRYTDEGFEDPKLRLYQDLATLEQALQKQHTQASISLTSFILSTSPYDEVSKLFSKASKREFEDHHVFFMEDRHYIAGFLGAMFCAQTGSGGG